MNRNLNETDIIIKANSGELGPETKQISVGIVSSIMPENCDYPERTVTASLLVSTLQNDPKDTEVFRVNTSKNANIFSIYNLNFIISAFAPTNGFIFRLLGGSLKFFGCSFSRGDATETATNVKSVNDVVNLKYSLIGVQAGALFFDLCSFKDLTLGVDGDIKNGSVACWIRYNGNLNIARSNFTNCVCPKGNGGAVCFTGGGSGTLYINGSANNIFDGCSASDEGEGRGGALFLNTQGTFQMLNITFGTNTADKGNNYYIISAKLPVRVDFLYENSVLFVDTPDNDAMGSLTNTSFDDIPLSSLIYTEDNVYVRGDEGDESSSCRSKDDPCHSISTAYGKIGNRDYNILIMSSSMEAGNSYISVQGSITTTIKPEADDDSTVSLTFVLTKQGSKERSFFYFSSGSASTSLILERILCELSNEEDTAPMTFLFNVTRGTLTLIKCSFKRAGSSTPLPFSGPLISLSGKGCIIDNCTFTGFTCNGESGGSIIYAVLESNTTLDIKGITTFYNCKNTGGDGGAIYADLQNGSLFIGKDETDVVYFASCEAGVTGTDKRGGAIYANILSSQKGNVCLNKITFGVLSNSTSGTNTASQGGNMFIESDDINSIIYLSSFGVANKYKDNTTENPKIVGLDTSDLATGTPIVLSTIIRYGFPGALYIINNGNGNCSYDTPCGLFSDAYNRVDSGYNVILIRNTNNHESYQLPVLNTQVTMDKPALIRDENTDLDLTPPKQVSVTLPIQVVTTDSSQPIFISSVALYPYCIEFQVFNFLLSSNSLPNAPIFSISNGYIYLHYCSFTKDGTSSSKSTSSYKSNDVLVLNSPLISISGGDIKTEFCTFDGFSLTKTATADVVTGGSIISAVSDETDLYVYVESSTFNNCTCHNGYGGAVYVKKEGGTVRINGTAENTNVFGNCQSVFDDGVTPSRGGAIYIESNNFYINNVNFVRTTGSTESSNSADFGKDYYIVSTSLEYYVNNIINNNGPLSQDTLSYDAMGSTLLDSYEDIPLKLLVSGLALGAQIYVNGEFNSNKDYCGLNDYPCPNLLYAHGHLTSNINTIVITQNVLNAETVSFEVNNNFTVTIKSGLDNSQVVLKVIKIQNESEELSLFNFTNAPDDSELVIESLTFEISNTSVFSKPMFSVVKGKLGLTKCNFKRESDNSTSSLYLSNEDADSLGAAIIEATGGSIAIATCSFSTLSRKSGNGAVLEAKEGGYNITISNTLFSNCICENGNGGALYVSLVENSSITIGEAQNDNTTFEGCNSEGEGNGKGGAVYVELPAEHGNALIDNVVFKNNDAGEGKDFYVKAASIEDASNTEMFKFLNDENKYTDCVAADNDGNTKTYTGKSTKSPDDDKTWVTIVIIVVVVVVVIILVVVGIVVAIVCSKKKKGNFGKYEDKMDKNAEEMKEEEPKENEVNEENDGQSADENKDISY